MGSKLRLAPPRLIGHLASAIALATATIVFATPNAQASDKGSATTTANANSSRVDHEAAAQREQGLSLYEAGEYMQAGAAFARAYELAPSPDLLFAWAQATRLTGDCAKAISLYQRFVATDPPQAQVDAANQHVVRCRGTLAAAGDPSTTASCEDEPADRPAIDLTRTGPVDRRRWLPDDRLGHALAGAGGLGFATAAGLFISARQHATVADSESSYEAFDRHHDAATRQRTGAAVALGTGVALGVAAIVRYTIVRRR